VCASRRRGVRQPLTVDVTGRPVTSPADVIVRYEKRWRLHTGQRDAIASAAQRLRTCYAARHLPFVRDWASALRHCGTTAVARTITNPIIFVYARDFSADLTRFETRHARIAVGSPLLGPRVGARIGARAYGASCSTGPCWPSARAVWVCYRRSRASTKIAPRVFRWWGSSGFALPGLRRGSRSGPGARHEPTRRYVGSGLGGRVSVTSPAIGWRGAGFPFGRACAVDGSVRTVTGDAESPVFRVKKS
jgi:hypothetical protein